MDVSGFGRLRVAIVAWGAAAAALFTAAGVPVMPDCFKPTGKTDTSGVTWRQTGKLAVAPTNAVPTLDAALSAQGYRLVHDIETPDDPGRHLLFWIGAEKDVMAMIWPVSGSETGMRWGFSIRGPEPSVSPNAVQTISNDNTENQQ